MLQVAPRIMIAGRSSPVFRAREWESGVVACLLAAEVFTLAPRSKAEPDSRSAPGADRFDLVVRGETHATLFRRALLPGPNGALVVTRTLLPVQQYVFLNARNLDTPWSKDDVDIELAAWGETTVGDPSPERALDGDVQAANVGFREGPVRLRLGRQHVAGGAARYSRFDGGDVRVELGAGIDAEGYAGFTVLPRWNARPGYYILGAAAETSLKDPSAVSAPPRSSTWLAGSRVGYRNTWARAGLSFHEERTGGLVARRDAGADAHADLPEGVIASGSALLDVDERRLANARLSVDTTLIDVLDLMVDYSHAAPALLLSRQSVLSVFSTDSYDEVGGYATLRAARFLRVESSGFLEVYERGRPGARSEVAVRATPDRSGHTAVRIEYARLLAPDNGYHSIRLSLARHFDGGITGTLEGYGYFYDTPIRDVRTSTVYAGTVAWQAARALNVLLGASLARSPFARLDAETQLRLAYDFDLSREGVVR